MGLVYSLRFFGSLFSACNCLLTSRNCLLTSQGSDAYCLLNSPKRVPAVYWFRGTLLYPCLWVIDLNNSNLHLHWKYISILTEQSN